MAAFFFAFFLFFASLKRAALNFCPFPFPRAPVADFVQDLLALLTLQRHASFSQPFFFLAGC